LVAELKQCLKKQQANRSVDGCATSPRGRRGQLLTRAIVGVSRRKPVSCADSPKFVDYEPPSRQKRGDKIGAQTGPKRCPSCGLRFSNTLGKMGVNKNQNEGGGIMKAKSLLLTGLLVATGSTFLSLPAGADCWMTCPPGSTATPSSSGKQGATATTEPAVSPEESTPAKEPETAAKASTTSGPAKPKVVPTATEASTVPAASPEELTQATKPEATAKASPTPVPKPKAVPTPAAGGPAMEPSPVQPNTPAPTPAPTQDAVAPSTTPLPPQGNAAFQPAPAPSTAPAPVPIPGVVPGTNKMQVIPE
jgi:hypothetical protein